jgi:hypothetical protein
VSICIDMDTCNKKKKCLFGPNEGQAYDPQNPCCGRGIFDAATCDCVPMTAWRDVRARWSVLTTGTGSYEGQNYYSEPGWYNGYQTGGTESAYNRFVYLHSMYFASTVAYKGCGFSPANKSGVLQFDYTISDSGTGLVGLENDVRRTRCIWPEDCQILNYTCQDYELGSTGSLTYTVTGWMTASRYEFDDELGEEVIKTYRLYDDLDMNDPNMVPEYIAQNIADIPMFTGENVGAYFNSDCACYDG